MSVWADIALVSSLVAALVIITAIFLHYGHWKSKCHPAIYPLHGGVQVKLQILLFKNYYKNSKFFFVGFGNFHNDWDLVSHKLLRWLWNNSTEWARYSHSTCNLLLRICRSNYICNVVWQECTGYPSHWGCHRERESCCSSLWAWTANIWRGGCHRRK